MRTNLQRLKKVIRVMDLVINKAMEIKEKKEVKVQLPTYLMPSTSSSSLHVGKVIMVGFDDVLIKVMDRLTRQQLTCLVIPISGMGGIGKTKLTRNVYETPYILQHFYIRAWVTVSQKYKIKEILSTLLIQFKVLTKEEAQGLDESQLGERVHKHLFGRRYLIVIDDIWCIDAYDEVQRFLPENGNGSRIIITTRLTNIASSLGSCGLEVDFLNDDQSWNLLHEKVFVEQECTLELKKIGKKIAKYCKGLPLSIVVIAGLLAKSNMTPEYWHGVAEKVSSIVSQADDGQCSKILALSYVNLPIHLKPCFLYVGVFPEDHKIEVTELIHLWVSEGFLKPCKTKSLEEIAEDYFMDLINRNLIMVHVYDDLGNVEYCKIHDLLRDLCIKEAEREKFFYVAKSFDSSEALQNQRRIVFDNFEIEQKFPASHLFRSITFSTKLDLSIFGGRLIRVLNGQSVGSLENIVNLVNLRFFSFYGNTSEFFSFSPISNLLWNIQILTLAVFSIDEPFEIWKMKQLRYLSRFQFGTIDWGQEDSNMKHIHTLTLLNNLIFDEGVVKRISNMKELSLSYGNSTDMDEDEDYCLSNLQHLHKLKSLQIFSYPCITNVQPKIVFPRSLVKLLLQETYLSWEDMTIIGCLPNLQKLILHQNALIGEEWNPIEGQFISLKYLEIYYCKDLKVWNVESIHFPLLENLFLHNMHSLEEIPLCIGEILTLRRIRLYLCSDSIVRSAIDILDDQENQGNDDLQVVVWLDKKKTQLQNLEARNNLKLRSIKQRRNTY